MSEKQLKIKDGLDDIINRDWERRASSLEEVKKKLRSGWRNDPAVLNQYFQSCVSNWKVFKGQRTVKQVLKVQALYKQAIYGDNLEAPPDDMDSAIGHKWQAWYNLRGIPCDQAKRRFITYLSEIDPLLIDVMPDEKPPVGFPLNRRGIPICAKCNTVVGCVRPLLDGDKINLRQQLFESPELHEPDKFKIWVKHALETQRCVWGAHQAISKHEAKPFMSWFEKDENRGFFGYDSSPIFFMIRELVHYHHEVAFEMMNSSDDYTPEEYNVQSIKATKLRSMYEELTGDEFYFEIQCTRNSDACNQRRMADAGKNHTHRIEIDPPTTSDTSSMEEAIELRIQCQKLGINPSTGVVKDISTRCEIYRERIAKHYEALKKAAEAKARNINRVEMRATDKKQVKTLSQEMMKKQVWEACQVQEVDHLMILMRRGANPNEQSPRGLTPLICLTLNDSPVETFEDLLIKYKANINMVNKYGLSALMLACRLTETKLIHILMKNDASAILKGGKGFNALHHCVIHCCDEIVKIIVDYLKDSAGDSLRVVRFLDAESDNGTTPLMLAASKRNGLMCHVLSSLGANPNLRDKKGRNAAFLAQRKGWMEIAEWLGKKIGAGVSKLETFSDLQFQKQVRYGVIKVRELIEGFVRTFLFLIQGKFGASPLRSPFLLQKAIAEGGDRAVKTMRLFVDSYQAMILNRNPLDGRSARVLTEKDEEQLQELRMTLDKIVGLLKNGMTYPNAESLAKPLPWIPLMCAVAINDMKAMKIMLKEGADPNHPNKYGQTPVMLAAQLNNTQMLVELLLSGGSITAVDNEGFNVMAYATSLPLPTVMDRDSVEVLLDGDSDGPKLLNASEILKMATTCGLDGLRDKLQINEKGYDPDLVENYFKFMRLLENNGLTRVKTLRAVYEQVRTSEWRVKDPILFALNTHDKDSEDTLDEYEKAAIQRYKEGIEAEQKKREEDSLLALSQLRCPICTLHAPCAHFFKVSSLEKYLLQKEADTAQKAAVLAEKKALAKAANFQPKKKIRMSNRRAEVLIEAHLGDRHTDRSIALVNEYRARDLQLERQQYDKLLTNYQENEIELIKNEGSGVEESKSLVIAETQKELYDADDVSFYSQLLTSDDSSNNAIQAKEPMLTRKQLTELVEKNTAQNIAISAEKQQWYKPEETAMIENTDDDKHLDDFVPPPKIVKLTNREPSYQALVIKSALKSVNITATTTENRVVIYEKRRVQFDLPNNELLEYDVENGSVYSTADDSIDSISVTSSNTVLLLEDARPLEESHYAKQSTIATIAEGIAFENVANLASEINIESSLQLNNRNSAVAVVETVSDSLESVNNSVGVVDSTKIMSIPPQKVSAIGINDQVKSTIPTGQAETPNLVVSIQADEDEFSSALKTVIAGKSPAHMVAEVGSNPVPKDDRKVYMFTSTNMGRHGHTDGLILPICSSSANMATKLADKKDYVDAIEQLHGRTNAMSREKALRRPPKPVINQTAVREEFQPDQTKVHLSGWMFVSTADLQSDVDPLESFELSITKWGLVLTHIRKVFLEEWLPQLSLEPLADIRTWKANAPRCAVCAIGFVRFKDSLCKYRANPNDYYNEFYYSDVDAEIQNNFLCVQCLVRKELYNKTSSLLGRSLRQTLNRPWPFVERRAPAFNEATMLIHQQLQNQKDNSQQKQLSDLPSDTERPLAGMELIENLSINTGIMSDITPMHSVVYFNRPPSPSEFLARSPIMSKKLHRIDAFEDHHNRNKNNYISYSFDSDDSGVDLGRGITPQTKHVRGKSRKGLRIDAAGIAKQELSQYESNVISAALVEFEGTGENLSLNSMVSSLSNSAFEGVDSVVSMSTISTITLNNPVKQPKELTLLPFLVAKGHYEEVERVVRIVLGKRAIDEGEGMLQLLRTFSFLGEMYKCMGLWPLSLAIYMDSVDISASLLGYSDFLTLQTVQKVSSVFRKMKLKHVSIDYINALCYSIEENSLKTLKNDTIRTIKEYEKNASVEIYKNNLVWIQRYKPFLPTNLLKFRLVNVLGIGGLYTLMTSTEGSYTICRSSFVQYCMSSNDVEVNLFMQFVDSCFRLRMTDDSEVYRHLVQLLIQKQLAKKLVSTSIVASQYRKLTSSNHIDAVAQYLKSGARLGVEVFDELLHYGLNLLLPVYKKFVLNNKYNVLVHKHLEIMNEIYDVYATVIQCQFRRFHAINVVAKVRNEFTEARTTAEIAANKKKKHRSRDEDT